MSALTAHIGYAYTLRQGARSVANNHAILDQPLTIGRLNRDKGDALCRPRNKFWGLEPTTGERDVTCRTCMDRATLHGVTIVPLVNLNA